MSDIKERYVQAIGSLYKSMIEEYPDHPSHKENILEACNQVCEALPPVQKKQKTTKKLVRGYIDGCFDIMHSGHYNAIRQAKALCDVLVVGVHSDAEILKHKGPPVMNEEERLALASGCKWADEIVFDTPYEPSVKVLDDNNCDFGVHGDDISTTQDGTDAYSTLRNAGRLKIIQRTTGVSTTDLVGRLLLMTKAHHEKDPSTSDPECKEQPIATASTTVEKESEEGPGRNAFTFLPTAWRLSAFANNKTPSATDTVVYVDGAWDLLHVGHIEFLQKARELGTFLIVGVHSDEVVNKMKGQNYPIMSLHERVLNVLAQKWVDEVVIGAPWTCTEDMITTLNVKVVAQGSMTKNSDFEGDETDKGEDPYAVPKRLGVYKTIQSPRQLMTINVVERIITNRVKYIKRNEVRSKKEATYLQSKMFVEEKK